MADHQIIVTAHKMIARRESVALTALFVSNSGMQKRTTRQNHVYHLPHSRQETVKQRFDYRAPALLNSLPTDVIE